MAKRIFTTLFLMLTISFVFGQKGVDTGTRFGSGEDSIRCIKNFSLYRSNARQKNYDDFTINAWEIVYNECPKVGQSIYIDGIRMIIATIKKEEDAAKKVILVDSMMRVYDKRIKYFNKKGFVLGKKGVDYINYSETNVENMQIGYELLRESISIEKNKSKAAQLLKFMQASNYLFKAGVIEAGDVVADFGIIIDIAEYVIANSKNKRDSSNMAKAKPSIEKIFEEGGAANCDDLVPFYAKKFEETPEDIEFLKKASALLKSTKCTESDLYFDLSVKLNSLEPTADLAYALAERILKAEKYSEAANYYKQAIELEEDDLKKAVYYVKLGDITRRLGDNIQARSYALKSIELDATSGYPYLLIGNIYAAVSKECSDEEFHQKAVYWAAVDKFAKAKSVDPELAAEANRYIEAYKARFPDGETIFMYGFKVGDVYTVGCWINEKTTVRAR